MNDYNYDTTRKRRVAPVLVAVAGRSTLTRMTTGPLEMKTMQVKFRAHEAQIG
jgi:hypothetical protein